MKKYLSGVIAVAVAVTGCGGVGGGGEDAMDGASIQAGATDSFCAATEAMLSSVEAVDLEVDASVDTLAADVQRVQELTPGDAPPEFNEFSETFASLTAGMIAISKDRTDPAALDSVLGAYDRLAATPTEDLVAVGEWLSEQCGDLIGDDRIGELVTGGASADSVSSGGETSEASGSAGETIGSSSADPTTTSEAATTTTTTVPVQVTELLAGLQPTFIYLAATYRVDEVVATNADLLSYVAGEPVAHEVPLVIARIFIETDTYPAGVRFGDFSLTAPDGLSLSASGMYDERNELVSSVGLDTRDSAFIGVWFEVDSILTDVDGWTISINAGGVPATVRLDEVTAPDYPTPLDIGGSAEVVGPNVLGGCDSVTYLAEVAEVDVRLESDSGFKFRRAAPGRRYVTGAVTMTNLNERLDNECDLGANAFDYGFRLVVDGRSISSEHRIGRITHLAPGTSTTVRIEFEIPSDATDLELVGLNDESVATWNIELPEAPGE